MQFFILENGKVIVADPKEVKEDGVDKTYIDMIDKFIEMAKEKAGDPMDIESKIS